MLSCDPSGFHAAIATVCNLHFYKGQFTFISFKIHWMSVVFCLQDGELLSDILPIFLAIFLCFSVSEAYLSPGYVGNSFSREAPPASPWLPPPAPPRCCRAGWGMKPLPVFASGSGLLLAGRAWNASPRIHLSALPSSSTFS